MKALSIKQPWASLIAHGIKDIENRTWKSNFRGRIYIHVSGKKINFDNWYDSTLTNNQLLSLPNNWNTLEFPYSAIIGEVNIIDCVINHNSIWAEKSEIYTRSHVGLISAPPIYNWVLANPVLYDEPILNVKRKLNFWEFEKPEQSEFCECDNPMQSLFPGGQYRCINEKCFKVWYH